MSAYPETASEVAGVFRLLAGWVRGKITGLTHEQLSRCGPEAWAAWSHITTRWFMVLYGVTALPLAAGGHEPVRQLQQHPGG
jgi:hypothetical protein